MDSEVKTRDDQTALMVAALANQVDVVKVLLEYGAETECEKQTRRHRIDVGCLERQCGNRRSHPR